MSINKRPEQHTVFGESIRINELHQIAHDISDGTAIHTGAAVLQNMLDTCSIVGFYPRDTNIFGRTIPAEVVAYAKVSGLISEIDAQEPHLPILSASSLADAYIYVGYRIGNGIRSRIPSHQISVNGVTYYIHNNRGRGISLFSRQYDQPVNYADEQVVRLSRRGILPAVAQATAKTILKAGDSEQSREALANYGEKVREFGANMLRLCDPTTVA